MKKYVILLYCGGRLLRTHDVSVKDRFMFYPSRDISDEEAPGDEIAAHLSELGFGCGDIMVRNKFGVTHTSEEAEIFVAVCSTERQEKLTADCGFSFAEAATSLSDFDESPADGFIKALLDDTDRAKLPTHLARFICTFRPAMGCSF